jgi:hypothetical protein
LRRPMPCCWPDRGTLDGGQRLRLA